MQTADNALPRQPSLFGSKRKHSVQQAVYDILMCFRECGPLTHSRLSELAIVRKLYTPKRPSTVDRRTAWACWKCHVLMRFGLVNRRIDDTVKLTKARTGLLYSLTSLGQEWIRMYEEEL